jgi:threonine dehydrogenase-like Zn-dependent dehydrogenase
VGRNKRTQLMLHGDEEHCLRESTDRPTTHMRATRPRRAILPSKSLTTRYLAPHSNLVPAKETQLKACTWLGGGDFEYGDVPDPVIGPDDVMVRIGTVGVCGTDVHITQGLFPSTPPQILGHEASGEIIDVGQNVSRERIGESVVLNHTTTCGECESCRTWTVSRCERSTQKHEFFAELASVPNASAVPIPEGLDVEVASITEPASCCLSGVSRLRVDDGAVGLVIGGGMMGLMTAAFMKTSGVETVALTEPVGYRRDFATQLGIDVVHDPSQSSVDDFVADLTNGRGLHIAAEAVGKAELVAKCVELVRPRGQVLMIGVAPAGAPLPVDLYDMQYREVVLQSGFGRGDVFNRTPAELAKLNMDGVITGRYELKDVPQAIIDSGEGKGVKLVIKPNR